VEGKRRGLRKCPGIWPEGLSKTTEKVRIVGVLEEIRNRHLSTEVWRHDLASDRQ
jgi:hypothetical protein